MIKNALGLNNINTYLSQAAEINLLPELEV